MILATARTAIAPYLAIIRIGALIALVGGVAFAGWRVTVWHDAYKRVDAAERELEKRTEELHTCTDAQTTAAIAYADAARAAQAQAEEYRLVAKRVEDELTTKLQAADDGARALARRLHDYQARASRGATAPASGAAGVPALTGREPSGDEAVERATAEALGACARDAERLHGWQEWWAAVEAARARPSP